jgi:hypothetical protein
LAGGFFQCICLPGFIGSTCQNVNDPCQSKPCQNQALCSSSSNPLSVNKYSCFCLEGFTGQQCEQLINPCDNSSCLNNSTCINKSTLNQTNSFSCACLPGYTGSFCQILVDTCQTQVRCINQGTCKTTGPNQYECTCKPGFSGLNCEIVDSCNSSPCKNGAACSSLSPNGGYKWYLF